ncbi:MAG: PilZ domain-containing protein [Candidatus Scalindua sp.]|nr:PilZ domain-containing protein [Candidatus Scalindua sp.]MCR4343191.1 PilZ domain-containing protein [Candidatus Scalindua sp.]
MMVEETDSENRLNQRLNLSFDISLSEQKGKTINVSATGAYFEIITDNIDAFVPGSVIPLQIAAIGSNERTLNLSGEGLIIREDIKETSSAGNRLCIAVQFTEKLNVNTDSS